MVKIPPLKAPDVNELIDAALRKPAPTVVSETGVVTEIVTAPATEQPPIEEPEVVTRQDSDMPWKNGNARITTYFQIRLPEPLRMKIEWLVDRGYGGRRRSLHVVALAALERGIDQMIAKEQKKG